MLGNETGNDGLECDGFHMIYKSYIHFIQHMIIMLYKKLSHKLKNFHGLTDLSMYLSIL